MYKCPGCKKRRSLDGGILCPSCTDEMVAKNALTPSQTVSMPPSLWKDVAYVFDVPARLEICRGCDMPAASVNHAAGKHWCRACS